MKWNQIAVAFLIGLLAGTLVGASPLRRHFRKSMDKDQRHERILNKFTKKLDLTTDQRPKVGAILEAKRKKIDAFMKNTKAETDNEIRAALTPDQQPKFDAFRLEMEKRHKRR